MSLANTRYPSPGEVGAAGALATLGALPLGQAPEGADPSQQNLYVLGAVLGAAVGGGVVGLVSAGDARGLATGGLLTTGLAGLANGFWLIQGTRKPLGYALGGGGVLAIAVSLFLAGGRP